MNFDYLYIFGTLIFTVYGQIILKWRMATVGVLPASVHEKVLFLLKLFLDPYIFSGFVSSFIAALFWMMTMTKFELTKAYPFMSLAPPLVFLIGILFLSEEFTWGKVFGLLLIISGIIVTVKFK